MRYSKEIGLGISAAVLTAGCGETVKATTGDQPRITCGEAVVYPAEQRVEVRLRDFGSEVLRGFPKDALVVIDYENLADQTTGLADDGTATLNNMPRNPKIVQVSVRGLGAGENTSIKCKIIAIK